MKKQKTLKKRSQQYIELKKQSLDMPGIKDLMIVYKYWEEGYKIKKDHQKAQELSYTTFNSANTLNPKISF